MNDYFDGLPTENGTDELDTDIIFPQDNSDADSSSSPTYSQKQGDNNKGFRIDKVINEKYRKKCKRMKKMMKALIFENGALCDEVAQLQEKILIGKEERRYLLKKLLHLQSQRENTAQNTLKANSGILANHLLGNTTIPSVMVHPPETSEAKPKKKVPAKKKITKDDDNWKGKSVRKKPTVEKKSVHLTPLDSQGRPIFPINLGDLTLHSLGEVIHDRSSFHTEDHIFPVGYCSSRIYTSFRNPSQHCLYTCTISDGGIGPKFKIIAEDEPERSIVGGSPNECHSSLLRIISEACGKEIVAHEYHGADFFGLTHPTIQNLIQSCPGTRKCTQYRWVKFEIMKNVKTEESVPTECDPTTSFDSLQNFM